MDAIRVSNVLVLIEHGSRRLVHFNITQHPTAAWTLQQLREAVGCGDSYRYLVHDRDSIFAQHLDASISRLGLRVLKSPPRSPKANAICGCGLAMPRSSSGCESRSGNH